LAVLPEDAPLPPFLVRGRKDGIDFMLIRRMRMNESAAKVSQSCRANLQALYYERKRAHGRVCSVSVNKTKIAVFPVYNTRLEPSSKQLMAAFLEDYLFHRKDLRREQKTFISTVALAVDHQKSNVDRVRNHHDEMAAQSFTITGDFGVLLNSCVVPSTAECWTHTALEEVVKRHSDDTCPKYLYVDCNCCSGKIQVDQQELQCDKGDSETTVSSTAKSPPTSHNSTTPWHFRSKLKKKLDAMHLMMRVASKVNAAHPRKGALMNDLRRAIFVDKEDDQNRLDQIRKQHRLSLTKRQKAYDRKMHVMHVIPDDVQQLYDKWTAVKKKHVTIDEECLATD
jgi:hypothetical protein